MGFMDKIKGMVGGNKDKVTDAVYKVADIANDKTGGKHADKIDMAADKVKDALD